MQPQYSLACYTLKKNDLGYERVESLSRVKRRLSFKGVDEADIRV